MKTEPEEFDQEFVARWMAKFPCENVEGEDVEYDPVVEEQLDILLKARLEENCQKYFDGDSQKVDDMCHHIMAHGFDNLPNKYCQMLTVNPEDLAKSKNHDRRAFLEEKEKCFNVPDGCKVQTEAECVSLLPPLPDPSWLLNATDEELYALADRNTV